MTANMTTGHLPLLVATAATFAGFGYFVAGLSTALGVGASLFCVPVLMVLLPALGVATPDAPAVAVATSLAASCVMSAAGAWAHWRKGNLSRPSTRGWRSALLFAAAGSAVGGLVMSSSPTAAGLLAVSVAQVAVAVALLIRLRSSSEPATNANSADWSGVLGDGRTGRFAACVGALTSIGAGGVFFVPYFTSRGVPRTQAAAWASLLGIAIAPCATAVYVLRSSGDTAADLLGLVHIPIALAITAGALFGAARGASLARTLSARRWTWLLFAVLLASSARAASKLL